ncbi:MAG: DUF4430 domain-containing protein [Coriobacteriaceae bacterium]|nr:MAG: DUF4430 domain-containing protein [Coriobacteriaceae bacterium]
MSNDYIVHNTNQEPEGADKVDKQPQQNPHPKRGLIILAIVIIAASVVGFVFAFRGQGGASLETTEPTQAGQQQQVSVTEDQVRSALQNLSANGQDVSVDPDSVTIAIDNNKVWIEQNEEDEAKKMALLTAQRTQSLTNALSDSAGGQVSAVWIAENAEGTVRFAIEQGTFADTIADNLHDILDACDSYIFSGATYKELSDDSIAQQKGHTITLPDGSEIPVTTDVDEEDLGAETTGAQQSKAQTNGASSENGQSQGAFGTGSQSSERGSLLTGGSSVQQSQSTTSSSNNGGNASSGENDGTISVSVQVDGSYGGGGTTSRTVRIQEGSTVWDALQASGNSVQSQMTSMGIYVTGINGVSAGKHTGWVYSVNGIEPDVGAGGYTLHDGDQVVWTFVEVHY